MPIVKTIFIKSLKKKILTSDQYGKGKKKILKLWG